MTDVKSALIRSGFSRRQASLIAASGGGAPPEYSFNPDGNIWSVTPGQNPGSAAFRQKSGGQGYDGNSMLSVPGDYAWFPWEATTPNSEVASVVEGDDTRIQVAANGLYLFSFTGYASLVDENVGQTESKLEVMGDGPGFGPSCTVCSIPAAVGYNGTINLSGSSPFLAGEVSMSSGFGITMFSQDLVWAVSKLELLIVRLD